jgi:hypothetical protein
MNASLISDEELHALLERTMHRVSESAPNMEFSTKSASRRWMSTAAAATLLVVGVGAAGFALRTRHDPLSAPTASITGPVESPLVRLDDSSRSTSIVKPGAVVLQLADGQRVTFDGYGQVVGVKIGSEMNGRFMPASVDVIAGAQPELGGNNTVVYWTGLPTFVSRVEFQPAVGTSLWQTPVGGVAAFPVTSHAADDTLVAFDATGDEVQRISWSAARQTGSATTGDDPSVSYFYSSITDPAVAPEADMTLLAGLTQLQEDEYRAFGNATMRSCLAEQGDSAWQECIQSTDTLVRQYLRDLQASLASDATTP